MPKDLFVSSLLDVYGCFLSEKQRSIASFYYNDDLSLSEIAENEGITRQGVSDLIKRAELQLREFEAECGYCAAFSRLKELAQVLNGGNTQVANEIISVINKL